MAGVNRLAELRTGTDSDDEKDTGADEENQKPKKERGDRGDRGDKSGGGGGGGKKDGADIAEHMKKYDPIKRGLDAIKQNVDKVEKLKARNKATVNEKSRKEIMSELDDIMSQTNKQAALIKSTLDDIKRANSAAASDEHNRNSAKAQMRANLYQTHIRKFHAVMNEYNNAAHAFKQELQKRTRREIKIVDPNLSDEQVEAIVESGKANDVIKQALISDNVQDVVRVIEERHADILKLEHQVMEIYELFRDLATLVDLQQESLDVIETRIMNTKSYTEKAEVELTDAEEYQKKARARRCCILMILLCVLVAILIPVLLTQLKNA